MGMSSKLRGIRWERTCPRKVANPEHLRRLTHSSRTSPLPRVGAQNSDTCRFQTQSSLCSIAYFTRSASELSFIFCIRRALWVLMVLLLSASC